MTQAPFSNHAISGLCAGTMVDTADGPQPVDWLRPGDRVLTLDRGYQPLLWVGINRVGAPALPAPLSLPAETLGARTPERALHLSPGHHLLVRTPLADLYFGTSEVLIPMRAIATEAEWQPAAPQASQLSEAPSLPYVHLMLARHDLLMAEGLWVESFFPDETTLPALPPKARQEIAELQNHRQTPELRARLTLTPNEAAVLRSRMAIAAKRMAA